MSCSAFGCTKRPSKESPVQFFRFPLSDAYRLEKWLMNVRRNNWTPTKSSRLCTLHFEEDQFFIDNKGKRRLKDTAVPTIFNFPAYWLKKKNITRPVDTEPVTYFDNGASGLIPPVDYDDIAVKQEPADETSIDDFVLHDDIIRIIVGADVEGVINGDTAEGDTAEGDTAEGDTAEYTTSGDSQIILHDHSYLCTKQPRVSECLDHSYPAESARALKRKADLVQEQLVAARKKLRTKCQQTRRMKSKLLSLKALTKALQEKLKEKERVGQHKLSNVNVLQEQLATARKKLQLKSQQTRRMKSRLMSLKALTKVLRRKLKEKDRDGLKKPLEGV
ncbi:THAP domain-containing protein 1 [Pempheris klunzingeri]|uniref:THAP domain-containing protein 1 n=1 Tax=Pempheris klunzingeri TaxID=3127111 RepID=UPI0039812B8D